ncbi:MAG: hypothetical protein JST54_32410 [Deltaproteobacteria bacterium]|nr:hypothetical protein [Deltaproteobacteria bacterium]
MNGVKKAGGKFGAPHFPPSENLPPQAKRLAERKRRAAAARGKLPRGDYPDALPRPEDVRAAVRELLERFDESGRPVLRSAAESFRDLTVALKELLRVPGQLIRAIVPQRQAG